MYRVQISRHPTFSSCSAPFRHVKWLFYYHWRELPQVSFLSRQNILLSRQIHIINVCVCAYDWRCVLSRQTRVCRDKKFCPDKNDTCGSSRQPYFTECSLHLCMYNHKRYYNVVLCTVQWMLPEQNRVAVSAIYLPLGRSRTTMKPCCCLFCFTKRKKEKFFVQQHMTEQSNKHCLVRKFLLQILWWRWVLRNQIDLVTKWVYNVDVECESLFSCVCVFPFFSFLVKSKGCLKGHTWLVH